MDIFFLYGDILKIQLLKDKNYLDTDILLGIRPEDIYPSLVKNTNLSDAIKIDVDYTELLGKENVIYGISSGQNVTMKTLEEIEAVRNEQFQIKIDINKIFFFDITNEMRIK